MCRPFRHTPSHAAEKNSCGPDNHICGWVFIGGRGHGLSCLHDGSARDPRHDLEAATRLLSVGDTGGRRHRSGALPSSSPYRQSLAQSPPRASRPFFIYFIFSGRAPSPFPIANVAYATFLFPAAVPRPHPRHRAPVHPRYDAQQALSLLRRHHSQSFPRTPTRTTTGIWDTTAVRNARSVHSPSYMPLSSLRPLSAQSHLDACPLSHTHNYLLHHHLHAQRSRRPFFIDGAAFFCPRATSIHALPLRLPGLSSTQGGTSFLRALRMA
ncbi:hypothetical protein B0H19DRAFT_1277219 [Mycena capillaripes]|nr:hypothetical protein B0H19DRAFT_1277219 [Mycena capillaripes]